MTVHSTANYPFITIENPTTQAATVTITYFPDDSSPVVRTLASAGTSRTTVQVYGAAAQGGIGGQVIGFGIVVAASTPVLVERVLDGLDPQRIYDVKQ